MPKQKTKVDNYKSIILREMTIDRENIDPNDLSPKSNKHIWVRCRYCGEPNRVKKIDILPRLKSWDS